MKILVDNLDDYHGSGGMLGYYLLRAEGHYVYARSIHGSCPDEDIEEPYWLRIEDSDEELDDGDGYYYRELDNEYAVKGKFLIDLIEKYKVSIVTYRDDSGVTVKASILKLNRDGTAEWIHSQSSEAMVKSLNAHNISRTIYQVIVKSVYGEEVDVV
jgi:hypothetical protein